jgi:hypothetical protein
MMVTKDMCEAAGRSVGWDVGREMVEGALAKYDGMSTTDLRASLERCTDEFDARQCRDAALADEIDEMRIALAARDVAGV